MSGRILIAGDEPAGVRLLGAKLDTAYYQVELVTDGASAIKAARDGAHDLVLLDVSMPGLGCLRPAAV